MGKTSHLMERSSSHPQAAGYGEQGTGEMHPWGCLYWKSCRTSRFGAERKALSREKKESTLYVFAEPCSQKKGWPPECHPHPDAHSHWESQTSTAADLHEGGMPGKKIAAVPEPSPLPLPHFVRGTGAKWEVLQPPGGRQHSWNHGRKEGHDDTTQSVYPEQSVSLWRKSGARPGPSVHWVVPL